MTSGIKAPTARRWHKPALRGSLLGVMILALFTIQPAPTLVQKIQRRGTLTAVEISSPASLVENNARNFQDALAERFADSLGVGFQVVTVPDANAALAALRSGKADIAITSSDMSDQHLRLLNLGHPLPASSQELVSRAGTTPASGDALAKARIAVAADSDQADRLHELAASHPGMKVVEVPQSSPIAMLDLVNNEQADYALVNTRDFDSRRSLFPDLATSASPADSAEAAWAFNRKSDRSLAKAAQRFIDHMQADGSLQRLASFYGQPDDDDVASAADDSMSELHDAIGSRLPHYRKLFEQNAKHSNMDWRLLAAIAWQESKWQADAVSPTGVAGMMMLTETTAETLNVADRNNANQSIRGGATYFRQIADALPPEVHEPDRTWMALAAYNMGPGYLDRARTLTDVSGDDPNKWLDVSSHLREMAQDARRAGHPIPPVGPALSYVQDVRRYYDALLMSSDDSSSRVAMNTQPAKPAR